MSLFPRSDPFKKKSLKEARKFFRDVPIGITDVVYDIYFYAAVGTLASYGTEDFNSILEEFTKFSSAVEKILGTSDDEKAKLLEKYPSANVTNWYMN